MHPYLLSLCQEYVELIKTMKKGGYSTDQYRQLDSQRQVTHEQLIQITGIERDSGIDMYQYALDIIEQARNQGLLYKTDGDDNEHSNNTE